MNDENQLSRKKFIQQASLAGAGLLLARPLPMFTQTTGVKNIKTKGYAAKDASGKLVPWEFERRAVGDSDILIEIKFTSICHSDIHTMKGDWGAQPYPQVPGHEIAGIVTAVGKKVTKFKVGDRAGVGCMVDSCMKCESCQHGEEQFCDNGATVFTYGFPDRISPSGISQGGYSNNIVVRDHFAVHIPDHISLEQAAPLLCAGITTYSPLINAGFKRGDKIGVAGIGGLGHLAVKLAVAKGADVYAFTTSPDKVKDILSFGVKEAILVDDVAKLKPYRKKLNYMISTIPAQFDVAAYASVLKRGGFFTQVGMPAGFNLTLNTIAFANTHVNFNASLIGGMPQTQEVIDYCADNKVFPQIQIIKAQQINDAWMKVINKEARFRYVIDAATF
ncbi:MULTISPECIES: NAD(P)-dependent alcohol dehydrogenase [Dyadobacter]|uniref:NAD(P)-dependent alcohol dehydrogenase n=1 Tax=Dyadobacter chenhuakuii TaxID=2909339 RepID=A0ABY4XN64_9BACT|nr:MULTISPECIES: NAD(P)-dependent alcohol dehydrogenase [Dyadobacter]MCF2494791.1 NAD(P)-dependent alcohol dehydrogenase [Dyadobacter chenhuakuii]MCF2519131.1 NAD(P)-dependent alcohol dehydrogenase [Dyadobacter sp. CY351]USJ31889.1 NAD(P)-dependent alcohol dehydrogenase [Dyadobacter chenhuakuii]